LTWDEFQNRFKPVANHLEPNAPFGGFMYETFGEARAFVEQVSNERPLTVWTIVEDDEGDLVAVDGLQWVNRFGFIVTKVARAPDQSFLVADAE